jgi:hypothetical protein
MSILEQKPDIDDLPDYRKHRNLKTGKYTPLDVYALVNLTKDELIAVTRLFYPEFIEYEGGVFFLHQFTKGFFHDWKAQLLGNIAAVERVMNHVHLAQDLKYCVDELGTQNLIYFGQILLVTWKAALEDSFPGRSFKVEGNVEEFDEGPPEFIITFWQPDLDKNTGFGKFLGKLDDLFRR